HRRFLREGRRGVLKAIAVAHRIVAGSPGGEGWSKIKSSGVVKKTAGGLRPDESRWQQALRRARSSGVRHRCRFAGRIQSRLWKDARDRLCANRGTRSEEHTSELQSQ